MILRALQNVKVPERPTSIGTVITGSPSALGPLVLRQVLWQLILLGKLDRYVRNLVATPLIVFLRRRRRVCPNTGEDAGCWLVDQTVLIRHIVW